MEKVYYIGYYSDPSGVQDRKTAPAADTKMKYIIESMNKVGYEVEVISFCEENSRDKIIKKYDEYDIEEKNYKLHFFKTYTSKFRIIRVIGRYFTWLSQKKYIQKNCIDKECKIIVYHSLLLLKVLKFLNKKNKKYILEMEEIYADVINNRKVRQKEIKIAKMANGYIFPTNLLEEEINTEKKPSVIIHGTYKVEKMINKKIFDKEKEIHCVYAGTFDPRKGCVVAATAAEYLPSNYHIHILGFGSNEEVENIKKVIKETKSKSKAKVTYDGLLKGEEYIKFIQNCQIGLSTQNPDAQFNETSFPSKILSYMANGLRVISIKIKAIEESIIGNLVYYYDEQTPQNIANAIKNVNFNDNYDSRKLIIKLDEQFVKDIKFILNEIK
jgi:hypothetical protein